MQKIERGVHSLGTQRHDSEGRLRIIDKSKGIKVLSRSLSRSILFLAATHHSVTRGKT